MGARPCKRDTQHAAHHWSEASPHSSKVPMPPPHIIGLAEHSMCSIPHSPAQGSQMTCGGRTSTRGRSGTATRARAAGSRRRAARRRAAARQGQGRGPGPARPRRGGRRTRRARGRCRTTAGGPGSTASARLRARLAPAHRTHRRRPADDRCGDKPAAMPDKVLLWARAYGSTPAAEQILDV